MALGGDLADINSIHCTVHRLQLVIHDSILTQRSVIDLRSKCRRIATHFNHSAVACSELKSLQDSPPLLPVQDISTRWNSTYLMFERMMRLKRPVQLYLADHDNLPNITANEWQLIERLLHILKPFFDLTKEMSGELSILSDVIPNIATLELFLSKIGQNDRGVQSTREALLRALKARFLSSTGLHIMHSKHYVTATCIDPRYKDNFFRDANDKQLAKSWLVEEIVENERTPETSADTEPDPPQSKRCKVVDEEDLFSSCFMEIAGHQNSGEEGVPDSEQSQKTASLKKAALLEVDQILAVPIIARKSNPFQWWKEATQHPLLQKLSRKLLATPSSSVFSERMYSEYGNIFEERRSRLLPRKGEKLLFLHHNSKKFDT